MMAGLENAKALYKPEIIAVSTTCMAEVIGDDLNAFINNTKNAGHIEQDFPTPYGGIPQALSVVIPQAGTICSRGMIKYFYPESYGRQESRFKWQDQSGSRFETYLGNYRVIRRMMEEMDVDYTLMSDSF